MHIAVHTNIDFSPQPTTPQTETLFLPIAGEVDVRLSYRHGGQGQSLIWLHWVGDDSNWSQYHQRLSEHFHLYVLNIPGCGGSTLPKWASSPRDLAVLVLGFLDALQIQNPTIVGTCLGGWVAAELATLRSERIAKLVLIDPLGLALTEESSSEIETSHATTSRRLLAQAVRASLTGNVPWPFPPPSDSLPSLIDTWQGFDLPLHSDALERHLPLSTTPTLLLWGEHDSLLSLRHIALWTSLLPYAKGAVIPGAGHLPYFENCTAVVEAIKAFVATEHVVEEFS